MDTIQLLEMCAKDPAVNRLLLGVFPCNKLPKETARPCALIVNTEPDTHPGKHWQAMFINKQGYGDFFCSYGSIPQEEFVRFMDRHCYDWNCSTKRLQQFATTTCGDYALMFLHFRAKGVPMSKILSLFTSDHDENDAIVKTFITGLQ